jgi:hypothetical protein
LKNQKYKFHTKKQKEKETCHQAEAKGILGEQKRQHCLTLGEGSTRGQCSDMVSLLGLGEKRPVWVTGEKGCFCSPKLDSDLLLHPLVCFLCSYPNFSFLGNLIYGLTKSDFDKTSHLSQIYWKLKYRNASPAKG